MKQFLIVKTSAIGDVIQSFHVVDYLKKRFPGCTVDWVAEASVATLVQAHPKIDQVYTVDTKTWRRSLFGYRPEIRAFQKKLREKEYDALFDLQGNTKSGLITALVKARKKVGYSWGSVPERTNYFTTNVHIPVLQEGNIRSRYLQLVQDFIGDEEEVYHEAIRFKLKAEEECHLQRLATLGYQRPRFMVCFGSNWENKRLSEKTLIEFLRLIDDKISPCFFFIYGNEKEKEVADRLEREFSRNSHTAGDMSLPLWQRFMQVVEGVIAMDSAALHLCGTTKTPSFSLFGPSSALTYKPLGDHHRAFQGICPYGVQFDKRCPNLRGCETGACLKNLSHELLFDQFQTFWNNVSKSQLVTPN